MLGAVVPVYNIPNVSAELKFSGPVLADIFLGKITKWNDPAIAKLNAGVTLPATDITVVHRSDGSGTTLHLGRLPRQDVSGVEEARSASRRRSTGRRASAARGNEGVAGLVKQTPGSIGYVELILRAAEQDQLRIGAEHGRRVHRRRRCESVTAAAAPAAAQMPAGLPRVDHERARQRRLSDFVLHLDAALREPEGQGAGEGDGRAS